MVKTGDTTIAVGGGARRFGKTRGRISQVGDGKVFPTDAFLQRAAFRKYSERAQEAIGPHIAAFASRRTEHIKNARAPPWQTATPESGLSPWLAQRIFSIIRLFIFSARTHGEVKALPSLAGGVEATCGLSMPSLSVPRSAQTTEAAAEAAFTKRHASIFEYIFRAIHFAIALGAVSKAHFINRPMDDL